MRITIDTKHDSKEEIMHAIYLIKRLVDGQFNSGINNEHLSEADELEQNEMNNFSAPAQGMFNMFNDNSSISNSTLINKEDKRQKEIKNIPKIETY